MTSLHLQVVNRLGNRCSNKACQWLNEDGTRGCTDIRCLQIDHKHGGGSKASAQVGPQNHYKEMLNDSNIHENYQLLCANCNWIKRHEKREFPLRASAKLISRNKVQVACPCCPKQGQYVIMKRWHFENCKGLEK